MKIILTLAGSICFLAATWGQSPVILTIDTLSPSQVIPSAYSGLSFGTISLKPSSKGYFFDSSNTQMITLFQQLGTKYLRIGGTSVDSNNSDYIPTNQDVDALFRFANATGVKVVYSLRLENGDPAQDAAMVAYVWNNYRQYLDCFAIGNEPNNYGGDDPEITNFSSYLEKWNTFANTITNSVPAAKLGGPDSDSSKTGNSWGVQFASNEVNSTPVTSIFFHDYACASSANLTIQQIIDDVLSTNLEASNYPAEYLGTGSPVLSVGFPYRFTEANSFYTGGGAGVLGGNNCFATALFSLDFMHWWAWYKCQAVCFHTSMWKLNGVFYPDAGGNYQVYPVGYGIKAFDLGGHGTMLPIEMTNAAGLNLTAYAVADPTNLYVTIINREHGAGGRSAAVFISPLNFQTASVAAMFLTSSNNDPSATNGITLGGSPINSGAWQGQWTVLDSLTNGQCAVTVPPTSAAVIKITPGLLKIQNMNSGKTQLNWGFGVLQSSTNVVGPFRDISNTVAPYSIPMTNPQQFYRVRQN